MATSRNQPALDHPRMAVVLAFSGLVGIAIPLMDHHYILLGYLICWGCALAICVLYYPQWRQAVINHFSTKRHKKKVDGRDYMFAPVFVIIYIAAPIIISLNNALSEDYLTGWGPPQGIQYRYIGHDYNSFVGARIGLIKLDGKLLFNNIGDGYKLFGICLHHFHAVDLKDEPNISISGAYDIVPEEIAIEIPWSQKYFEELIDRMVGTNYVLIAVPTNKAEEKIRTIRDAIALGGKILATKSGPPKSLIYPLGVSPPFLGRPSKR
jgi:hypothetical protein